MTRAWPKSQPFPAYENEAPLRRAAYFGLLRPSPPRLGWPYIRITLSIQSNKLWSRLSGRRVGVRQGWPFLRYHVQRRDKRRLLHGISDYAGRRPGHLALF